MSDRREVELAREPTPEELSDWYAEHNIKPGEDGKFTELPYGPTPVEKAKIVEQVRANAQRRDVRNLTFPAFNYNPKTMVFVCGGPTLSKHLDELREKSKDPAFEVYTSNKTCQFLLENGIVPKYHVIIDPTEKKAKDLDYDCDEVTLLLGLQCHPAVFDAIGNRKAFKFLAASATDREPSDVEVAQEALTPEDPTMIAIGGGSMMGTRALYLGSALGHRRIEYYGFDAGIEYDDEKKLARMYAYDKQRGENILEIEHNGRTFYSTLALSRQCNEIVTLMSKLPGMEVIVHGDSFMAAQVAAYKALNKPRTYRFTEEYVEQNEQLHKENASYGTSGHHHASRVFMASSQICRKSGQCVVLDYGCGKETLRSAIELSFPEVSGITYRGYDPSIPGKDGTPEPAELVVCTDVMEHVEPECVEAVIRHLHDLTKQVCIVDVYLQPAIKTLPDGRNAHICLRDKDWWKSYFSKYFVVIEQQATAQELLMVLQPIERYRERKGL
jgi:uncharacterized Rossmann fold enzyme